MESLVHRLTEQVDRLEERVNDLHGELAGHRAQEERYLEVLKTLTEAVERHADFNLKHHESLAEHMRRTALLETAIEPLSDVITDWQRAKGAVWAFAALGGLGGIVALAAKATELFKGWFP